MSKRKIPVEERFWPKVDRRGQDECWVWLACRGDFGYGAFWNGFKPEDAHKVSYRLAHGPIAEGLCVLHKCDNPPCVNPAHLFLGTQAENLKDMWAKGRDNVPVQRGEANGRAKLCDDDIRDIRVSYAAGFISQNELAGLYRVRQSLIWRIIHKRVWTHIE